MTARRLSALLAAVLCWPAVLPASHAAPPAPAVIYLSATDPKPALGDPALLEVHFLSVKASDCILLRTGGRAMLIDCGNLDTGDAVVAYLQNAGVTEIDFAFASHYHSDHIAGYLRVLEAIPVMQVLLPEKYWDYRSGVLRDIRGMMAEKGLTPLTIGNNASLPFGAARLTFFQLQRDQVPENDRSVVARVDFGGRSALFAADVENRGQNGLASAHGDALAADILKMPHHGIAAYQRPFHEAVNPKLGVISNYARAVKPVLAQMEAYGVPWLLTTDGPVIAVTDGESWWVWQDRDAGAAQAN